MPKSALHGPASGFFSQKKKMVVDNIKHSGNKKNISLVKLGLGCMYSDLNSKSSGGATTLLKFEKIIKSTFTLEISIKKAISLAKENGIIANINVKKQEILLNWTVVIKKISMDMPKEIIITVVAEFGEIKSIKI
ncbi:hypothetical protein G9A89_007772 [Geosiphon pyriformis]|nr:hypothetical protein G9A89_007772 [Geosiphon pyriformis]